MTCWEPILNLETLQEEHFHLTETDTGVVYQSVINTDLYDLLNPYLENADYSLYFNYSNRILRRKFIKFIHEDTGFYVTEVNDTLLKKAVYYALKGEEYNLRTLINTLNLEYNPIENYSIMETITTTSSIGAYTMYGETSTDSNTTYSEFKTDNNETLGTVTSTKEVSRPEHTTERSLSVGGHTDTLTLSKGEEQDTHTIGSRTTNGNSEDKVSAYNTLDYQPNTQSTNSSTTQSATDTDTLGARTDKNTNVFGEHTDSEKITYSEEQDIDTTVVQEHANTSSSTQHPHDISDTSKTLAHRDDTKRDENETRTRDAKGNIGVTTSQQLIESERALANINIAEKIVNIVIHAICEGVLLTC